MHKKNKKQNTNYFIKLKQWYNSFSYSYYVKYIERSFERSQLVYKPIAVYSYNKKRLNSKGYKANLGSGFLIESTRPAEVSTVMPPRGWIHKFTSKVPNSSRRSYKLLFFERPEWDSWFFPHKITIFLSENLWLCRMEIFSITALNSLQCLAALWCPKCPNFMEIITLSFYLLPQQLLATI